eukprot:SAG31_NODE_87_length_26728_cov_40.161591_2_plen_43_part_00
MYYVLLGGWCAALMGLVQPSIAKRPALPADRMVDLLIRYYVL